VNWQCISGPEIGDRCWCGSSTASPRPRAFRLTRNRGQFGELLAGSERNCCDQGSMLAACGEVGHFSGMEIVATVNRRKIMAS
jgi:hypothetical protein